MPLLTYRCSLLCKSLSVFFRSMMLPPSFMYIYLDKGIIHYLHSASKCLCKVVLVILVTVQCRSLSNSVTPVMLQKRRESSSPAFMFYHFYLFGCSQRQSSYLSLFVKVTLSPYFFTVSTYLSSSPITSWVSSTHPNADEHVISEAQRLSQAKIKYCKLLPFFYSAAFQFSLLFCSFFFLKFYFSLEY